MRLNCAKRILTKFKGRNDYSGSALLRKPRRSLYLYYLGMHCSNMYTCPLPLLLVRAQVEADQSIRAYRLKGGRVVLSHCLWIFILFVFFPFFSFLFIAGEDSGLVVLLAWRSFGSFTLNSYEQFPYLWGFGSYFPAFHHRTTSLRSYPKPHIPISCHETS